MTAILVTLAIVIALVAIVYYLAKKFAVLLVNAVLGLILLVLINFFHVMAWMGRPDLGYDIPVLLVCAIGGVPGVAILMLLSILGITV